MLQWLLAHACFAQGNLADAIAVAESVLAVPGLTPLQQGQFHGFRALAYVLFARVDVVEEASARAISIGEACADPVASGLGSFALGLLRFHQGFLGEAQQLGDRLIRNFESNGRARMSHIQPYSLSGRCLVELDQSAAARKTLEQAVRYSEHTSGVFLGLNRLALAQSHFLGGRWDESLSALRACREVADVSGHIAAAECLEALVAVHRGTFVGTPESLGDSDDRFECPSYRYLRPWAQALIYETQADPGRAFDTLWGPCEEFVDGLLSATTYHAFPDLVRLALAAGRKDLVGKVAAVAETVEARYSTHSRRATVALCRGLAEDDSALVARAVESFREAGRPWYQAQASELLAAQLAAQGGEAQARSALDDAVDLYAGFGADWDIARAEARMREFGIRRGRRGRRNRPRKGWQALTPTEQKVAALVAQGLTNPDIATRMFLSPRTVQSHISSILTKLKLQSRIQVAIAMARQDA